MSVKSGCILRYIPKHKWLVAWDENGSQTKEFEKILKYVEGIPLTTNKLPPPCPSHPVKIVYSHHCSCYQETYPAITTHPSSYTTPYHWKSYF